MADWSPYKEGKNKKWLHEHFIRVLNLEGNDLATKVVGRPGSIDKPTFESIKQFYLYYSTYMGMMYYRLGEVDYAVFFSDTQKEITKFVERLCKLYPRAAQRGEGNDPIDALCEVEEHMRYCLEQAV